MNDGMLADRGLRNEPERTLFTLINCNARSLCPKLDSLIDCFNETEAAIGFVTETWMTDTDAADMSEKLEAMAGNKEQTAGYERSNVQGCGGCLGRV